jgi:hypothetical protein
MRGKTLFLVVLLAVTMFATPSRACPYDCYEGVNPEGGEFAECAHYTLPTIDGRYADCTAKSYCYHMPGGGRECHPFCDGEPCFIS